MAGFLNLSPIVFGNKSKQVNSNSTIWMIPGKPGASKNPQKIFTNRYIELFRSKSAKTERIVENIKKHLFLDVFSKFLNFRTWISGNWQDRQKIEVNCHCHCNFILYLFKFSFQDLLKCCLWFHSNIFITEKKSKFAKSGKFILFWVKNFWRKVIFNALSNKLEIVIQDSFQ